MDISVEEIPLKGTVCSVVITFLIFEKIFLSCFVFIYVLIIYYMLMDKISRIQTFKLVV